MNSELILDNLINENDRIAVGVSGGADSMFLLHLLLEKRKNINFFMEAIHVNHHLRDKESDRDCEFVKDFCERNNIELEVFDIDVKKLKSVNNKSIEETARIARYDLMYQEMRKNKLTKLFLAHHANDQAETILMHIFRGSGLNGAVGIRSNINKIVRPLLNITKKEIVNYCKNNCIDYVNDSSNGENEYTRNYIRNVVIPNIEVKYPDVVNRICLFGERCSEIMDYITGMINTNLIEENKHYVLIKGDAFDNKKFLVREYIKLALDKLKIYSDFESKHYTLISELNNLPVNSMINLPHEIIAKKTYEGVKLYKKSAEKYFDCEISFSIGMVHIKNFGTIKSEIVNMSDVSYNDGNYYLDYYKVSNKAVWRFRKPGDVFAKLGSGSKKLNNYFTDKKIDVELRDTLPVLAYQKYIYMVAGYDISEYVKIDADTDKVLKITIEKDL